MRQPSAVIGKVFCSRRCCHIDTRGTPSPNKGKSGAECGWWRGGTYVHEGYRHLHMPDHPNADPHTRYVPEHRYVMSETLGRPLESFEHVHHINHDKLDNRPENLEIVNASEHMSIHQQEIAKTRGWSEQFAFCIICRTVARPHYAHGKCHPCYSREYMRVKRAEGYITPSRRK